MKYQLAENQELESCFDCPLSHKCMVVKGCTNEQAEWYAGRMPQECPLEMGQNRKHRMERTPHKGGDGDMMMTNDKELFELVRENYNEANKEYLQKQIIIASEYLTDAQKKELRERGYTI